MKWYIEVLKKYAVFNGRARRAEYWYFVLFNIIASLLVLFVDMAAGTFDAETGRGILGTVYSLAVIVPSVAVGVRRMHDVGKSGWYLLIPFYNLYLAVTEGEIGSNQYGSDPKNPNADGLDIEDHLVS